MEMQTTPMNQEQPEACVKNGDFLRDMNVVLDAYHIYGPEEVVPSTYRINLSKLPKDDNGVPLFVMTKRGMERPIPANKEVQLRGDMLLGVNKVLTFQGQRELIHDLGVELAKEVADSRNVDLLVLPGEEQSVGIEAEKKQYLLTRKRRETHDPKTYWLAKEEEKW
ncbi:hypothetical protein MHH81_20665 [Psychrobacillus sp. FSL H8-0484]|uniref:hypothetical protein n=1 Tax=Psychrobacillus sp. FSL H8-0484 TaxID=2921390 RepID=UPI0030F91396